MLEFIKNLFNNLFKKKELTEEEKEVKAERDKEALREYKSSFDFINKSSK